MNIWSSWRGSAINNNGETFEVLTYVKFQQKGYCCWMFLQPALISNSFPLPLPPSSLSFHSSLSLKASDCCTSQGSDFISCQTLAKWLKFPLYCQPLPLKYYLKNTFMPFFVLLLLNVIMWSYLKLCGIGIIRCSNAKRES